MLASALLVVTPTARADEPAAQPTTEPEDPAMSGAHELFSRGTELVKKSKWSEALAAFEKASAMRPHAVTSYNIGVCFRALGRYLLARKHFRAALERDREQQGGELSETLKADTQAFIAEADGLLARVAITLRPVAAIAIDGRPLEVLERNVMAGGTRAPGPPETPPASRFELLIDPGVHVITLSRKGYRDAVVNRQFGAGSRTRLALEIAKLPATLKIDANREKARVKLDNADVGLAPLRLERPAGRYKLLVDKEGYAPYETTVAVGAGEEFDIRAKLTPEPPPLYERWWFWGSIGGAAASVAVTAVTVWFLTYDPDRPAADGGGLGWVVEVD